MRFSPMCLYVAYWLRNWKLPNFNWVRGRIISRSPPRSSGSGLPLTPALSWMPALGLRAPNAYSPGRSISASPGYHIYRPNLLRKNEGHFLGMYTKDGKAAFPEGLAKIFWVDVSTEQLNVLLSKPITVTTGSWGQAAGSLICLVAIWALAGHQQ